jgi:predicted dehydrogenase
VLTLCLSKNNDHMKRTNSRRKFVKKLAATSLVTTGGAIALLAENANIQQLNSRTSFSANDQINLGFIGMGIMGFNNAATAIQVPGVKLVAACDLYKGRLTRTQEVYGSDVAVTQNYHEILDRNDIDAVVISTTDHWHQKIAIDAMEKGKAVYCEKPLMQKLGETKALLDTQKKTKKVLQVGSQRVSSIVNQKAHELYQAGMIGQLVVVESWTDRFSAMGAWQYSIPPVAGPDTVDWEAFLGNAPKRDFDATRFFRWRNYQDYGTGVAGDLFVHLLSGLHAVTNSLGPNRVYATGGLRYWKDGRDVAFGVRAAAPAVASNLSIYEKRVVHWDPETMSEIPSR